MEKVPLESSTPSLLRLSIQNMLTLVSVNLMLFVDRIILAKYSTESLNASVAASAICNIFIFGAIAMVGIGDVFIGQCFGAGRTKKIGEIIWQMVWFSLITALVFCALSRVLPGHLWPAADESSLNVIYFKWTMCLGFLPVLVGALTSFFVGTKRFGFALMSVVMASTIKLILELPLVFGIDGFIPSLGIKGAILATAISQVVHIIVLALVMVKKENRSRFRSLSFRFQPSLFAECLKLGMPQSLGNMLNYAAWGIVVSLLASAGQKHLMMYTIIDSLYALFGFATEGLQKSVLSISANLIGSGQTSHLPRLFKKALLGLVPILLLLAIPLLFFPGLVSNGFDIGILSQKEISLACLVIWIYFGFDGISWILNGLLTAMGDTLFVSPINGLTSFIGAGATYAMTVMSDCRPEVTCWVSIIYGLLNSMLLLLRYKTRRRNIFTLLSDEDLAPLKTQMSSSMPLYQTAHSNGSWYRHR